MCMQKPIAINHWFELKWYWILLHTLRFGNSTEPQVKVMDAKRILNREEIITALSRIEFSYIQW